MVRMNSRSSVVSNKIVIVQVVDLKVDLVYLHLVIINQEALVVDLVHPLHRYYYKVHCTFLSVIMLLSLFLCFM